MDKLGHFQQVFLKVWKIKKIFPKIWKFPHLFFNFDGLPKYLLYDMIYCSTIVHTSRILPLPSHGILFIQKMITQSVHHVGALDYNGCLFGRDQSILQYKQ